MAFRYFLPFFLVLKLFAIGGQKVGTTQAQFLKIGVGPRYTGLAGACVSIVDDATSLYWNPGAVAFLKDKEVAFSNNLWFVDTYLAWTGFTFQRGNNSFGFQVGGLLSEYMEKTDENHPFGIGEYFNTAGLYVGFTYAFRITERFGYGLTFKFIQERLADVKYNGFALDLGALYIVGYRDIKVGISLRHLGPDMHAPPGYEGYSLPITYDMGVSGQIFGKNLYGVLQVEKPSDGVEKTILGMEYRPFKNLMIEIGYDLSNVGVGESFPPRNMSFGMVLKVRRVSIGYSVTGKGILGTVYNFGVTLK